MAIYFEWDEEKARKNLREHGIDFSDARFVLLDPYRIVEEDSIVEGEQRWRSIGTACGVSIVLVIHLEEDFQGDLFVRMISARYATPFERSELSKIVRMTSDEPLSAESIKRLQRLADMPASEIRTDLIPERRFDLKLAAERRKAGWTPGKASAAFKAALKKAS